jgi:hypothetical protein
MRNRQWDFRFIDHFSPKIEGLISLIELFMKRNAFLASLYCHRADNKSKTEENPKKFNPETDRAEPKKLDP